MMEEPSGALEALDEARLRAARERRSVAIGAAERAATSRTKPAPTVSGQEYNLWAGYYFACVETLRLNRVGGVFVEMGESEIKRLRRHKRGAERNGLRRFVFPTKKGETVPYARRDDGKWEKER